MGIFANNYANNWAISSATDPNEDIIPQKIVLKPTTANIISNVTVEEVLI